MKIKVSEATGPVLNWLVEQCEMMRPDYRDRGLLIHRVGYGVPRPEYSSDWLQGGPIIEREGIGFFCNRTVKIGARFKPDAGADWRAFAFNTHDIHHYGPTPLIAAMRCYAVSTLGDYADVPEALAHA